jgi:hypothetical protein
MAVVHHADDFKDLGHVAQAFHFDRGVFVVETAQGRVELKESEVAAIVLGAGKPEVKMESLSQWAIEAKASSQYSETRWSAMQATGEPNTERCGDIDTAWAPRTSGPNPEWLQIYFETPVYATQLRVHETYNAGSIYRVEFVDVDAVSHTVWEDNDTTKCPGWFELTLEATKYQVQSVVLHTRDGSWEEIDAVQLTGLVEVKPGDAGVKEEEATEAETEEPVEPEVEDDVLTVAEVLAQRNQIGTDEVKVRGELTRIEHKKGILGIAYTTFMLRGDDGSTLEVHLDRKVTGLPEGEEVVVTGSFETFLGDLLQYFTASEVDW